MKPEKINEKIWRYLCGILDASPFVDFVMQGSEASNRVGVVLFPGYRFADSTCFVRDTVSESLRSNIPDHIHNVTASEKDIRNFLSKVAPCYCQNCRESFLITKMRCSDQESWEMHSKLVKWLTRYERDLQIVFREEKYGKRN